MILDTRSEDALITSLLTAQEYESAEQKLTEALEASKVSNDFDRAQWSLEWLIQLYSPAFRGDLSKYERYRKLLSELRPRPDLLYRESRRLFDEGKSEAALAKLEECMSRISEASAPAKDALLNWVLQLKGEVFVKLQRFREAEVVLNQLIDLSRKNPGIVAQLNFAEALLRRKIAVPRCLEYLRHAYWGTHEKEVYASRAEKLIKEFGDAN